MDVQRIAAFCDGARGGNPAGVVLCPALPEAAQMQSVAKQVGYSETAFAAPDGDRWRVRYFAPEIEVPFCGHATIALGAALAMRFGDGTFPLLLNQSTITVDGWRSGSQWMAALQSPPTRSAPAEPALVAQALALFSYRHADLDPALPPSIAEAGARHLVLALKDRQNLSRLDYDLQAGRVLMISAGLVTINLVHAETETLFHARNPFAAGGVYEDPATGAAAAALAGYLRDLRRVRSGGIDIVQGTDMDIPCRLRADITTEPGASIRVSGTVRLL